MLQAHPGAGSAVFFYNTMADGNMDYYSLHESMPVVLLAAAAAAACRTTTGWMARCMRSACADALAAAARL